MLNVSRSREVSYLLPRLGRSLISTRFWLSGIVLGASVWIVGCSGSGTPTAQHINTPTNASEIQLNSAGLVAQSAGCLADGSNSLTEFSTPLPLGTLGGAIKLVLEAETFQPSTLTLGSATFIPYALDPTDDGSTIYLADVNAQLIELDGVDHFGSDQSVPAGTCLQIFELIDPTAPTPIPEIVANLYQNDPQQITLTDVGLAVAARQLTEMEMPITPENLVATANNLLPGTSNDQN